MFSEDDTVETLRARVMALHLALNDEERTGALASTFRLTPTLGNLLGLLMAKPVVSYDMIMGVLKTTPKVAAHRLKKELAPWGITIRNKRHVGWWLDDVTKEKIGELTETATYYTLMGGRDPTNQGRANGERAPTHDCGSNQAEVDLPKSRP